MIAKRLNNRYAIYDIFPAFNASEQILTLNNTMGHVIRNDLCDDEDIKREILGFIHKVQYTF